MSNADKFEAAYRKTLGASMEKNPEQYFSTDLDLVISRMMPAIIRGSAAMSPTIKAACKLLGINPTYKAIKEFLS